VASSAQRQVPSPNSADDGTWLDRIGGGLLSGPHVSVVTSGANCLPHDVRQNRQSRQSMNQSLLVGQRSGLVNMHGGNVREDNYQCPVREARDLLYGERKRTRSYRTLLLVTDGGGKVDRFG
jgi:hypothetical protein